jgi:hypothetical protein
MIKITTSAEARTSCRYVARGRLAQLIRVGFLPGTDVKVCFEPTPQTKDGTKSLEMN